MALAFSRLNEDIFEGIVTEQTAASCFCSSVWVSSPVRPVVFVRPSRRVRLFVAVLLSATSSSSDPLKTLSKMN